MLSRRVGRQRSREGNMGKSKARSPPVEEDILDDMEEESEEEEEV